jgi:hypothetical protein
MNFKGFWQHKRYIYTNSIIYLKILIGVSSSWNHLLRWKYSRHISCQKSLYKKEYWKTHELKLAITDAMLTGGWKRQNFKLPTHIHMIALQGFRGSLSQASHHLHLCTVRGHMHVLSLVDQWQQNTITEISRSCLGIPTARHLASELTLHVQPPCFAWRVWYST